MKRLIIFRQISAWSQFIIKSCFKVTKTVVSRWIMEYGVAPFAVRRSGNLVVRCVPVFKIIQLHSIPCCLWAALPSQVGQAELRRMRAECTHAQQNTALEHKPLSHSLFPACVYTTSYSLQMEKFYYKCFVAFSTNLWSDLLTHTISYN